MPLAFRVVQGALFIPPLCETRCWQGHSVTPQQSYPAPNSFDIGIGIAIQISEDAANLSGRKIMLWAIFMVLLLLWLVGLVAHIGGALIHLLLVVAAVMLIINLVGGS